MTPQRVIVGLSVLALLGCAPSDPQTNSASTTDVDSDISVNPFADLPSLTTRHTSIFNKISYRIPAGWVVIDGETDWIAPRDGLFIGQEGFDPDRHAYYGVSVVFPHLSMDDMETRRVRTFRDVTEATSHALGVAAGATGQDEGPNYTTIGDYDAAVIDVVLGDGAAFHQTFLALTDTQIASVAAGGPVSRSDELRDTVRAIALTVRPPAPK